MSLPIDAVLGDLRDHKATNLVLQAPPGAGKTTRVPLALLDAPWRGDGRILMLEPRRLAARAAAARMAKSLGESVGETVGYRIRLDSRVSARTRIEVVTEGILTRMIQDDPALEGVAAVIFDEFHERSLNADLGLAFCLEAQASLREDLHILVMSATLDGEAVARLMGDAPLITSPGRSFPVDIRWLEKPVTGRFEDAMARLIERALDEEADGDLLAFLPGQAEIRRVEARLSPRPGLLVAPLFGEMSQAAQDQALEPQPGRRKVVLATNIAETSLTIEGIRIVVDGGQARQPRFDPNGAMTRLVTVPIAKASAEQRAGRAGRTAPGICYRLWTEAEHRGRAAFAPPEIAEADLAPLALDMARWGWTGQEGAFLDPPPAASLAQARGLLNDLGALDDRGRITGHGREMAELPLPPRLAHMLIEGKRIGLGALAADLAALLSERDILKGVRDCDLHLRLEALGAPAGGTTDRAAQARVRDLARQLRRQLRLSGEKPSGLEEAGLLLAFAYPDRIARRRGPNDLHYLLSGGRGAHFDQPEPLATSEWLTIASLDGNKRDARIFLAAAVSQAEIEEHFGDAITEQREVVWESRAREVLARRIRRLGALTLEESRLADPKPEEISQALLAGVAEMGLDCLPWNDGARALRQRIAFLRGLTDHPEGGEAWPDCTDATLMATLSVWLGPWLDGASRRAHLDRLDMTAILRAMLTWEQTRALDRLAPTHMAVPSGSQIPIDYSDPERPALAVRLQEMFGLDRTPAIAGGTVQLTVHLLSPARRPVQVTRDLASFWANAYKAVKADLKGQYPKHYWPDDPLQAEPTARAKPRR